MRYRIIIVLAVILTALLAIPASAKAYENDYTKTQIKQCRFARNDAWNDSEVRDLIRCAFRTVGDSKQVNTALIIADRESGFQEEAYNSSGCAGLFQHMVQYWSERYESFPLMDNWYNLSPSVFDPRSNAFITARMVGTGNWGPWSL
jgi:hypothetical protein